MANPAVITTDTTVYPSKNQIETAQYKGSRGQESTHGEYKDGSIDDHIVSGFVLPGAHGDLDYPIPKGKAFIRGRRIENDSANDLTLADNQTNHIFLQVTIATGAITVVQFVANTTGTPPSNSLKIGQAITSGGAVTSSLDNRQRDPYRSNRISGRSLNMKRNYNQPGDDTLTDGAGEVNLDTDTLNQEDISGRAPDILVQYTGFAETIFGAADPQREVIFRVKLNGATQRSWRETFTGASITVKRVISFQMILEALDEDIDNTIAITGELLAVVGVKTVVMKNQVFMLLEVNGT